jgi:hypothetical protein
MHIETILSPSNYPPRVGKFTDDQIAQRSTWSRVPDADVATAAMHIIHIAPAGASTVTVVNRMDPATVADDADGGWLEAPTDFPSPRRSRPANWIAG